LSAFSRLFTGGKSFEVSHGYQRRINAVLRSYMQQKAKPKKRP
jgi:hypothetical protein